MWKEFKDPKKYNDLTNNQIEELEMKASELRCSMEIAQVLLKLESRISHLETVLQRHDVPEEPNFDAVDDRQGEAEAAYLSDQEARQQIEELE